MSLVTSTMPANGAGRSVSEFAPTQNGSKRADPNQNRSKRIVTPTDPNRPGVEPRGFAAPRRLPIPAHQVDPAGHRIKLRRPSDRPLRRPKLPSKLAFVPPSRVSCTATSFEFRWPDPFHWPGLVPTKPRPHRFHDVLHRSLEPLSPAS
ncbi:hypothetical protein SETIT_3G105600v2 [Setaria italica]|uniref:Uncharacterized protein n=1 Tax=Setaria italica TaxID=4555 RepID=A0A368QFJ3_SETIT|nr:hypothetical protein SETIT_3G105600v2 [Setaria italica]